MDNTVYDNQKIIKHAHILLSIMGVLMLFIFSHQITHADISDTNIHCEYSDSHVHQGGNTSSFAICSGTISYAVNSFYEGANLFGILLKAMVSIAVTGAFFFFFWNLVKYIRDEEGKEEAKIKMGYSLGAIFVIVTLWGIIGFVRGILGIGAGESVSSIDLPTVNWNRCTTGTYAYTVTEEEVKLVGDIDKTSSGCAADPCAEIGFTLCSDKETCHKTEPGCLRGKKYQSYP